MLYLCSLITKCGLCENTFTITKTDILDKLSISDVRHFEYSLIYLSSISFDYKVHSSWYSCNILASYKHFKGYFKVVFSDDFISLLDRTKQFYQVPNEVLNSDIRYYILKKKLDTLNLQASQELIDEITEEITSDKTISEEDKKTMLKVETINLYHNDRILHELLMQTTFVVNQLGLIIDKDSLFYNDEVATFLDEEDMGFLGKDKKTKEKVANKLCETFIAMLKEETNEETKKEC